MRLITWCTIPIKLLSFLLLLGIGSGILSCGGSTDFLTASLIPAPHGYVKVKLDRHDHYVIQLYLQNLIHARQLPFSNQSYVVWMVSDRGITKNIGEVKSTMGLFSTTMKSTFRPASPLKPARIYITAENDPGIQYSNTEIVFSTSTFQE